MMGIAGRRFPIARAAVPGAAAFLAGYLLTAAWLGGVAATTLSQVSVRVRAGGAGGMATEPSLAGLVGLNLGSITWSGWLWANAHFVPVVEWSYPTSNVAVPNLILAGNPSWLALFLLPPVLLLIAGGVAARGARHGQVAAVPVLRLKLPAGLVRGMSVWIGYLPASVIAAFSFTSPTANSALAPLAPSLVGSVVLAGFVYPVVFAGIGGWVGSWLRDGRSPAVSNGSESTTR